MKRWLLLAAAALCVCTGRGTAQELELRFLDVGQGDAALIRNQGKTALIDAGRSSTIVDRLQALGVTSIDLLVASHNHADHIGGAEAVLSSLPVRFYLDNGYPATTQVQSRVLAMVQSKGIVYLQATARTITLGDATLRIIPPADSADDGDQNNHSVGIILERGHFRALLTGDSQVEEINAWLAAGVIPRVMVLKAPHHGSRNGVTPGWLTATHPDLIVISVGANNSYGHPDLWALRYYQAGGRQVYRTDLNGEVVITVTPEGQYSVRTGNSGQQ